MELGYVAAGGHLVIVDTLGWRTLFPAFRLNPATATVDHLARPVPLERRRDVTVSVHLHRKGWGARGEAVLRRTRAIWHRGSGLDVFLGPKARSIRVPWRGELAKVRRPFFALEAPIKDHLKRAGAHGGSPCVVWLERSTVRGCRRSGRSVEVYAVERKEFSDFILGRLRATIEFGSEEDAAAFSEGLPPLTAPAELDRTIQPDITRSKRVVWTPKTLAIAVGLLLFSGFVTAGTVAGLLEGKYLDVARVLLPLAAGLVVVAAALHLLLRVRRREFLDLVDKWPRVLCERWGADYRTQAARASDLLRSMDVRTGPDLSAVDAYLRSLPPEAFYGTLALQVGLMAIDRLIRLVGREVDAWWEYLPDRRECAFRVEAAGLRLYPLTAVMTLWQQRDPEGLDPFVRTYARELQLRLAFHETLPAFVALGFTSPGWEAFSKFAPRVDGELAGRGRVRLHRRDDVAVRERVLECGSVQLVLVEETAAEDSGDRLVPTSAFPFLTRPATAELKVDPTEDPDRHLAVLPLGGAGDHLIAWFPPAAARAAETAHGTMPFEICGVVEAARTLAHLETAGDGTRIPLVSSEGPDGDGANSALNHVTARVVGVSEGVNALNDSRLWLLTLDLGNLQLPLAARGDIWQQPPRPGEVFDGAIWIFLRLPSPG
ncbi:MAG: hypothetical protein A3K65_00090 [Euryarchaeota archaeon RBG_16_68_12]|nr:MAG: hypothetical protein A3K65_00090 [Euryarchaeota archaeon RBG_16_68_12]